MAVDSMLDSLRAHLPPERVDALIQRFRTEAGQLVASMRRQYEDPCELGRTAHRLRGKSLVIGADTLAALCADLERDPASVERHRRIEGIHAEVERLVEELAD